MKHKISPLFLILLLSRVVFAGEDEVAKDDSPFFNGHNLSISSHVLVPGRCAVGLDILACGVPGDMSIGSSVWMWADYGMWSLALRKRFEDQPFLSAYQITYFETKTDGYNGLSKHYYKMTALWNQFVKTFEPNDHYKLHLNFHVNYYFDDDFPFSLRRPSMSDSPWQFNISILHEFHMVDDWYMLGETGILDVTRDPVHLHSGASVGLMTDRYSIRFGFSLTGSLNALFSPVDRRDYQQAIHGGISYSDKSSLRQEAIDLDYAIHPEFSFFYVF